MGLPAGIVPRPHDHTDVVDPVGLGGAGVGIVDRRISAVAQQEPMYRPIRQLISSHYLTRSVNFDRLGEDRPRIVDGRELPPAQEGAVRPSSEILVLSDTLAVAVDPVGTGVRRAAEID